ncbi:zinc finger protein 318 isoform X1 [Chiloscyllium plagiosum]|uniref:zinc finger protein 318 isoform X1 n=2 Tax=Chiloscyllium plagiosum TaxID=36176 RepID=UPI001CB81782|nr:zinc finger protein 318 isoform X1 [Chiloscyllium plagiosum]XP_043543342.1 zinc finger protein 318 isoform X1 [Chiloscyllium plagiosum]XP_043543343.1 zinc finger protein 318 isoform X1 [Chiloscyllium plagiosum]XP_043543345.1 zinc finger protein 318 isoform X1 [Chiloscyllium plagiosum]
MNFYLPLDEMDDGLIYRIPLQRSSNVQGKYPIHDDQTQGYLDMIPSGDSFKRRPDYGLPGFSHRQEGRRSSEHGADKLKKIPYPHSRSDDRGRDPKRSRLEHRSRSKDHHSREQRSRSPERHRSYRARSSDRRRSISPPRNPSNSHAQEHFPYSKSKNDEFRELEIARRRKEQEERIRAEMLPPPQRELSNRTYGLSEHFDKSMLGIQQSPSSSYVLHRPDEAPQMPKKSILKKRTESGLEPSTAMQFDEYRGATVKESPEQQKNYVPPQSFTRLPQHTSSYAETEQFSFMRDTRDIHQITEQGGVPGLSNASFLFERDAPVKIGTKSNLERSEIQDRVSDFLLPHERAGQDGHGFCRILGLLEESENGSLEERRKHNFPDIEDEERFLYGEDEEENAEGGKHRGVLANRNLLPVRQTSLPEGGSSLASAKPEKEYEKIHDLLKTIGLDIGVTEISKLAARTEERLHGKKPVTRSPEHPLGSLKTASWEKRRSRNEAKSPEPHTQTRARSHKLESISGSVVREGKDQFNRETVVTAREPEKARCSAVIPTVHKPGLLPIPSQNYAISPYGQYPAPAVNYPPNASVPNYNQYDPYVSLPASNWPMYPPPQVTEPYAQQPKNRMFVVMQPPKVTRPNLRVIETVNDPEDIADHKQKNSVLVQVQTTPTLTQVPIASSNRMVLMPDFAEEEKRKSEQKQKVLEEKAKLLKEKEARAKRLDYLGNELQKLRKQQGELLRKKRREKDGHKDPLLLENGKLQEDIVRQMSLVRQQVEETVKKLSELEKVAQILGVVIQDQSSKSSDKHKGDILEKVLLKEEKSASSKEISTRKGSLEELDAKTRKLRENLPESRDVYEYYDTGNHWCKNCNTICGTLFDFFTHMHNKRHRQTLDPYDRPWSAKMASEDKNDSVKRTDKITMPAKGSEFLMPVTGFYCQLCEEFYGDQICAEDHVKSRGHNDKYKGYLNENPVYEQRRNLDRQAGLVVITETERRRQAGLKRKLDEEKEIQKRKRLEESDERKAKLIRLAKEEGANVTELEEERSDRSSSHKIDLSIKPGIKLMLKKDEVEDKKDEEQGSPFGKFSWKKPEKEEEKISTVGIKEESVEGSKEKDDGKGQAGKSTSKLIEIKLSGKTLIAHTSPWVPFTSVSTTTQAKIRPNLPVANVPLRKASGSSVNKPAPLDTFLSIRSSGASNKPLPVVKAGVLLAPDVISRAFGGEEVTLKGSILDVHKEPDHLAEEPAPGVSEGEQTILAVPVRPPPPPAMSLTDSSKKSEKPKTCLAAANAKDLYGIYYSSSGKTPVDKLGNSAQSARLVSGTLKSIAGQVKNKDGKLEELICSENATTAVPKPTTEGKSSEIETDEHVERRGISGPQAMRPREDYDFSTSTTELQNKASKVTGHRKTSAGKVMINTAEQSDEVAKLEISKLPSEKLEGEEMNALVSDCTEEHPPQDDHVGINSGKVPQDVELQISILDDAEQSQQSDISNTVEQAKDVEIDAVVSNVSEQPQQCHDLISSCALKMNDIAIVSSVFTGAGDRSVHSALAIGGDVDNTYRLDNVVNLTEQFQEQIHELASIAERHLEVCNAPKSNRDMELDSHALHNNANQPAQCDTDLKVSEPLDEVKDVQVDVHQYDTGVTMSEPVDEVKDVQVDVHQYDADVNVSEPVDEIEDVQVDVHHCDSDLNVSEPIHEVKDVQLDVHQYDTDIIVSEQVDEVKDIKVDAFISDNTTEQYDVGFSIISPVNEVRDVEINTSILVGIMEQQQFSAVEPARCEETGGGKMGQIGNNEMSNLLQSDLCDNHVKGGPISNREEKELSDTLQIKLFKSELSACCKEKQDIDASALLQAEQFGTQQGIPKPTESCREMNSSQQTKQHENREVNVAVTQLQDHGSSFREPEDLSECEKVDISNQTRHSDSQISTSNVKIATSVAEALKQSPQLQSAERNTSDMAQKESKSSVCQLTKVVGSGKTDTREECKSSGSSRTSSRRAAQVGKAAMSSQTTAKTNEKRESDESVNVQAKQPRRRSARNLRSTK